MTSISIISEIKIKGADALSRIKIMLDDSKEMRGNDIYASRRAQTRDMNKDRNDSKATIKQKLN